MRQCQLSRQLSQDAADAPFMHPEALGNFGQQQSLPPQSQQFVMLRRAKYEHSLPQLIGLRHLAGARLPRCRQTLDFTAGRLLASRAGR